jgi:hypothetical protein
MKRVRAPVRASPSMLCECSLAELTIYIYIYIIGVLARAANITLTQFPRHIYSDTASRERVIMHTGLAQFGGFELDVRWDIMQRQAFGNETFEEMLALEEEEIVAKEIRHREQNELEIKQGLKRPPTNNNNANQQQKQVN